MALAVDVGALLAGLAACGRELAGRLSPVWFPGKEGDGHGRLSEPRTMRGSCRYWVVSGQMCFGRKGTARLLAAAVETCGCAVWRVHLYELASVSMSGLVGECLLSRQSPRRR